MAIRNKPHRWDFVPRDAQLAKMKPQKTTLKNMTTICPRPQIACRFIICVHLLCHLRKASLQIRLSYGAAVHSNGASFYNQRAAAYAINDLQSQMDALLKDMRSITVTFLFLLTLCSPLSIMSTDHMDCLDCDMTPPDGSQYWVAPFISEFFKSNLDLIDESCMKYLQDNTLMEFES